MVIERRQPETNIENEGSEQTPAEVPEELGAMDGLGTILQTLAQPEEVRPPEHCPVELLLANGEMLGGDRLYISTNDLSSRYHLLDDEAKEYWELANDAVAGIRLPFAEFGKGVKPKPVYVGES